MGPRPTALALLYLAGCSSDYDDLSAAQLEAVTNEMRPTVQVCYQAALDRKPHAGEVRMEAAIYVRPSGAVYQVQVGEGGLPGMKACVEQAIIKWRFPPAGDETQVSLPFHFNPQKS